MKEKYAEYLKNQTHQNYNLIASDYTRTRSYTPEDLQRLGGMVVDGDRILDSGCANGYFFDVVKNKNIDYFGVDISEELIKIAQERYYFFQKNVGQDNNTSHARFTFQVSDALNLSFPDNFFDKVYSFSVLHNIPSKKFQDQYLREIMRVLKPGGLLILRVWDLLKIKMGQRLVLKYLFLKIIGKSELDFGDIFVPWKNSRGKILAQRYFHCFTKGGIRTLALDAGFNIKKIWRSGKDKKANIYLIAQK